MAWISTKQLTELFVCSLFNTSLSVQPITSEQRQEADETMRKMRADAINYGDCLTDLVATDNDRLTADPSLSQRVRFAATLQLEALINDGWKDGSQFSDKPRILQILHELPARVDGKLLEGVMRCLARCCVVDSPNMLWEEYLQQALSQIAQGTANNGLQRFVLLVCQMCYANIELWQWMITAGCQQLPMSTANSAGVPCKAIAYEMLAARTPHGYSFRKLAPASLPGEMCQCMMQVSAHVQQANGQVSAAAGDALIACHSVFRALNPAAEHWTPVLRHSLELLFFLKVPYTTGDVDAEKVSAEILETLQMAYDNHEEHFTAFPALDVFGTLIAFAYDPMDEDEESALEHLHTDLVEDSTSLAGCASGKPCDIACSIIQLFINYDQGLLAQVVDGWISSSVDASSRGDARACAALARMITAVGKQCEVCGLSLIDSVPQEGKRVVSTIINLLSLQLPPILRARFLLALGSVCQMSKDVATCRSAFGVACANLDPSLPNIIRTLAVSSAGRILGSSLQCSAALEKEVPSHLLEAAVAVCCDPSSTELSLHAGIRSIALLMNLAPQWNAALWQTGSLTNCLSAALHHCSRATVVQQLSVFVRELLDSHAELNECSQFQSLIVAWIGFLQGSDSGNHPSTRSLIETSQRLSVHTKCSCRLNLLPLHEFVINYAAHHGPHDDPTVRCLAVAVGSAALCVPDNFLDHLVTSAWSLLKRAVELALPKKSFTTVSVAGTALGLAVIRRKGLTLHEFVEYTQLLNAFSSHCTKDFNVTGALLPAAATGALVPDVLADFCAGSAAEAMHLFAMWISLFPFADRRTQHYSVVAWKQLIDNCGSSQQSHRAPVLHNFVVQPVSIISLSHVFSTPKGSTSLRLVDAIRVSCDALTNSEGPQPARLANFSTGDEAFHALDCNRQVGSGQEAEDMYSVASTMVRQLSG